MFWRVIESSVEVNQLLTVLSRSDLIITERGMVEKEPLLVRLCAKISVIDCSSKNGAEKLQPRDVYC